MRDASIPIVYPLMDLKMTFRHHDHNEFKIACAMFVIRYLFRDTKTIVSEIISRFKHMLHAVERTAEAGPMNWALKKRTESSVRENLTPMWDGVHRICFHLLRMSLSHTFIVLYALMSGYETNGHGNLLLGVPSLATPRLILSSIIQSIDEAWLHAETLDKLENK